MLRLIKFCSRVPGTDARRQLPLGIISLAAVLTLIASSVQAQNGSFLESLFRSIAEQQMQKATDSNRRPGGVPSAPGGPSPPPFLPRPTPPPGWGPPASTQPGNPAHPHDVHQFDVTLTEFHNDLDALMRLVQTAARSRAEYRSQLPALYQLQADVGVLASRAESASRLEPLLGAYRGIDQRYRELSFRLRAIPDRDSAMRTQIARCDRTSRALGKIAGIDPQFDRHGLHDQMVIAATYIQALIDDLPTARVPRDRSRTLVHQARLLRQTLLEDADQVEDASYDEIVSRHTDFVARWTPFAESVTSFRDPVLDRRLSRISQCSDETYALLWLAPPTSNSPPAGSQGEYREQWIADAAALEGIAEYFHADLQRLQRYLRPDDYARSLLAHSREIHETARSLHSELERGERLDRLQRSADRLLSAWKSMSAELDQVERHGLSSNRASALRRQQQQMLPLVASLSAALLQRTP